MTASEMRQGVLPRLRMISELRDQDPTKNLRPALELIFEARHRGLTLSVGEGLTLDVEWDLDNPPPEGVLEGVLERLRESKPAILRILDAEEIAGRPVIRIDRKSGKNPGNVFVFEAKFPRESYW